MMIDFPDPKTGDDVPLFDSSAHQSAIRYRVRNFLALAPEQRLAKAWELQKLAFETLQSNPIAFAAFTARNHHRRRREQAKLLEQAMRRPQTDHEPLFGER